jgi:ATP-binding protein involved in chromosome partitioning
MKIAIPTADGALCMHFGHCERFMILDVDDATGTVETSASVEPPPHEPGALPAWLAEKGVEVILAGGMGQRAQALFERRGVRAVTGVSPGDPAMLATAYVKGALQTGSNACDH